VAVVTLAVSVYYNYKFALYIFKVEDAIEASLDELDTRYQTMSEIMQRPVFFDSIEVRQVIAEIGMCRDTVLRIARRLSTTGDANERSSN
jgi:hypothetical protein